MEKPPRLHFWLGKPWRYLHASTFSWRSHGETSTPSFLVGEAMEKPPRLHFCLGKVWRNLHSFFKSPGESMWIAMYATHDWLITSDPNPEGWHVYRNCKLLEMYDPGQGRMACCVWFSINIRRLCLRSLSFLLAFIPLLILLLTLIKKTITNGINLTREQTNTDGKQIFK